MLRHIWEALGRFALGPKGDLYFDLTAWDHSFSGLPKKFHAKPARKAWFAVCNFFMPNPPSALFFHKTSQAIVCKLLLRSLSPQKNFLLMRSKSSKTNPGSFRVYMVYVGITAITNRISMYRVACDKVFILQPPNFLTLDIMK